MTQSCLRALTGAALATLVAMPAADFTARFSVDVQEGHPKEQAAQQFATAVAEVTGDAVEIQVFANSLLGGEAEAAWGPGT
jgi:TRAP-type C4-dicarboxylate transport system substrate-binding protein